jgi:hypothetical protein
LAETKNGRSSSLTAAVFCNLQTNNQAAKHLNESKKTTAIISDGGRFDASTTNGLS